MGDSGVSIPPWSVIFGLLLVPTGVFFCAHVRARRNTLFVAPDKESRLCLRSTKNGVFLLGHVIPKRNTPLLGHLGTVLRLDVTYVWTER